MTIRERGASSHSTESLSRAPRLRESLSFGSSTAAEQAAKLATNLVVAASLGPTVWGYWFMLNLVIRYGSLSHFGAINGMSREVPAALGRGEPHEAGQLQRAATGHPSLLLAQRSRH